MPGTGNHCVTFELPVQSPRRFLFNDGIVTVESQSYGSSVTIPPLSPFFAPSMIQRDLPRPAPVGANHNAVSNGIVGGQLVIFYKAGLP